MLAQNRYLLVFFFSSFFFTLCPQKETSLVFDNIIWSTLHPAPRSASESVEQILNIPTLLLLVPHRPLDNTFSATCLLSFTHHLLTQLKLQVAGPSLICESFSGGSQLHKPSRDMNNSAVKSNTEQVAKSSQGF